jgi:predicted nucleic acid-binding protein
VIVIDGSALVIGVVDTGDRGRTARRHLASAAVAPHLVDAETGQGIRGLVLRGQLEPAEAERSLAAARNLVVDRFAHHPLLPRAWELRGNVSFYDGLYVALAEALQAALVTADAKLANATGPRCAMHLV